MGHSRKILEATRRRKRLKRNYSSDDYSRCLKKKVYSSYGLAKAVMMERTQHDNQRLRIYQCPSCGFYHLTHK